MGDDRTAQFPTTCWSRIISAGDPAAPGCRDSLAGLCRDYWYPLYAFIRRKGNGCDASLDLTQDYFARLLERGAVAAADPARGRFRSFLLADCNHFLAHCREGRLALKRGGGVATLPIDVRDAEGRYDRVPAHGLTPERLFEVDWALTLLERVLGRLRAEYEGTGRGVVFEALKDILAADPQAAPYADLSRRLGMTPGAVQVAVHRLRRRYRSLVREEIAATVQKESEVDEEIRDLFAALAR